MFAATDKGVSSSSLCLKKCEICDDSAQVFCFVCDMYLCLDGKCDEEIHKPKKKRSHQRTPLEKERKKTLDPANDKLKDITSEGRAALDDRTKKIEEAFKNWQATKARKQYAELIANQTLRDKLRLQVRKNGCRPQHWERKLFPFTSEKIDVITITGKGKAWVAAKPIQCGDLLLKEIPHFAPATQADSLVRMVLESDLLSSTLYCPPDYADLTSMDPEHGDAAWSKASAQCSANQFLTTQSRESEQLLCLHVMISVFNHNCMPNASIHFYPTDPPHARAYAISDIAKGDEVCISYQPFFEPTVERQAFLKSIFGFCCDCNRCTHPELFPNDALMTATTCQVDETEAKLMHAEMHRQHEDMENDLQSMQSYAPIWLDRYCEKLRNFLDFTETFTHAAHWYRYSKRKKLILLHTDNQEYFAAALLYLEQIEVEELILPKYHNHKLVNYHGYLRTLNLLKEQEGKRKRDIDTNNYVYVISKSNRANIDWDILFSIENIFQCFCTDAVQ